MYNFVFRNIYTSRIAGGERKILQSFVCASLSSTRRKPCLGNLASSASASKGTLIIDYMSVISPLKCVFG